MLRLLWLLMQRPLTCNYPSKIRLLSLFVPGFRSKFTMLFFKEFSKGSCTLYWSSSLYIQSFLIERRSFCSSSAPLHIRTSEQTPHFWQNLQSCSHEATKMSWVSQKGRALIVWLCLDLQREDDFLFFLYNKAQSTCQIKLVPKRTLKPSYLS